MKKYAFAGIFAAAASLASSHAAVIETPISAFGPVAVGSPSFNVNLPKFDQSLGTLTSIEFLITANATASSLVFDNEGTAGSASFLLNSIVRATAAPGVAEAIAPLSPSRAGNVAADSDAAADFAGTDSLALTNSASSTGSATEDQAPNLTQFTGAAGTTYPVAISSSFSTPTLLSSSAGVTGIFSSPSQTVIGTVKAIYTFTPLAAVPEAGTLLFGAALGLALGFRRMRSQAAA